LTARVQGQETETHWVDVLRMIWNWRVATTPKDRPRIYERHCCYAGTSLLTLIMAVRAVAAWGGADGTEPEGRSKNGQSGEWREPAWRGSGRESSPPRPGWDRQESL
jgi:hypothetical protein